jgi:hypothetical protein
MIGSAGTLTQALLARRVKTDAFIDNAKLRDLLAFSAAVLGFVVLLVFLGLYVSTAIYLALATWRKANFRPVSAAALGIGVSVFFFVSFEYAFKLPLPKGPILSFFGIY